MLSLTISSKPITNLPPPPFPKRSDFYQTTVGNIWITDINAVKCDVSATANMLIAVCCPCVVSTDQVSCSTHCHLNRLRRRNNWTIICPTNPQAILSLYIDQIAIKIDCKPGSNQQQPEGCCIAVQWPRRCKNRLQGRNNLPKVRC